MSEIYEMSAIELADAIQRRQIGIEELTRTYLERIARYDGPNGLNAVAELNDDVIAQARKLDACQDGRAGVFGLPILVKDNIDVAGLHTTAGSLALSDNVATRDAPVIANLRRHGALILGKTNMTEFANYTGERMPNGYSSRGGQVRNAYDPAHDPSGSSTGSAVAVSARLCSAALGTDTSFSIVGCATENGVTGIKPAHGALSQDGIVPIAHTLDSAGPIAQSLADALMIYACMRDEGMNMITPTPAAQLRIAVNVNGIDQISNAQRARYTAVLDGLCSDGARTANVEQPPVPHMRDIMRCEFRHDLELYLAGSCASRRTLRDIVEFYEAAPDKMMRYGISYLRAALDSASGNLDDAEYLNAMSERKRMRAQLLDELGGFDACLMTGPTNAMHFAGLPSVALRMGMGDDGVPRGMILYGADERRLLSAALTIERYCPPVSMPALSAVSSEM